MKLIFFSLLFLSFSASAQTIQYYTEAKKPTSDKAQATSYTETITADSLKANVKTYSINGILESEQNYSNLKKKTLDGISKNWFKNGALQRELHFKNGKLDGTVKSYYENGQLRRNDLYKASKLIKGQCFTSTGADTTYFPLFTPPMFPGGEKALMKFLSDNLKISEEARNKDIKGKVIVTFEVSHTGKITNINFLKKAYPDFNREVLRVLNAMPAWQPGTQDGIKVKTQLTLPVSFNAY